MTTKIAKFGFEIEGEFSITTMGMLASKGELKNDGSLSPCCNNLSCKEFITEPIEYTEKGRKQAHEIFQILADARKKGGFHWNDTAGFHIHVSFSPQFPPEVFSAQFYQFFHERLDKKYPGVIQKRGTNRFCTVNRAGNEGILETRDTRYKEINFFSAFQKHKTIEIRIFPSTLPKRMYLFLLFTLQTLHKFLEQKEIKEEFMLEFSDQPKRKIITDKDIEKRTGLPNPHYVLSSDFPDAQVFREEIIRVFLNGTN